MLDLSFVTFLFLSGRHLHFFCQTEAESRNTKLALGGFFSQPTTLPPLLEADIYVGFVICYFRISVVMQDVSASYLNLSVSILLVILLTE